MRISSKYKIWRYPMLLKIKYFFKSIINHDKACITYWVNANIYVWSSKIKHYNWGDYVNLKLAELISGRTVIPSKYTQFSPKIAMMGSILPWAMDNDTIVWGSGCLNSHDPQWAKIEKPMKVCAVRGPLTRNVLIEHGIDCPDIYGDPALLFPRYYQPKTRKLHKIGVIPHISSVKQAKEIANSLNGDIVLINPGEFSSWHEFIDKIATCEIVFSASLHGIIIADAYGVPNVWVSFSGEEHADNNFKFHDYFLSVGKSIEKPLNADNIEFEKIEDYIKAWEAPNIDIDKLLEVCPLK